jgi:hypothetical protein
MATTARLGIDIVGTDRTRAGFASVQRSMAGLNRTASQLKGAFAGIVGGNILAGFIRSMVNVNRQVPEVKTAIDNLSRAWQGFALKVGDAGFNTALINFANRMGMMVASTDGLSTSIGKFLSGGVNVMAALFEGIGRSIAFVYDNLTFFGRALATIAVVEFASRIIALSRGFVLFISTLRAAGLATAIFTLIQRRMLLMWAAIIAIGAKVTGTFEKLTEALNSAYDAGSELLPVIGDSVIRGLNQMGFSVKSLTSDFSGYEATLAGLPPITTPATKATKDLDKAFKGVADSGSSAMETLSQIGQTFSSAFSTAFNSVIDKTSSVGDAFKTMALSILKDVTNLFANSAIQQLFGGKGAGGSGGGFLGGIFSKLFGGGAGASFGGLYAEGGTLGAGKWGIAGENGMPEIVKGPASIVPMRNSGGVQFTLIDQRKNAPQIEHRQDAKGNITAIVRDAVNNLISSGQTDSAQRGRFGLTPSPVRR